MYSTTKSSKIIIWQYNCQVLFVGDVTFPAINASVVMAINDKGVNCLFHPTGIAESENQKAFMPIFLHKWTLPLTRVGAAPCPYPILFRLNSSLNNYINKWLYTKRLGKKLYFAECIYMCQVRCLAFQICHLISP